MPDKTLRMAARQAGLALGVASLLLLSGCGTASAVEPRITKAEMGTGKTENYDIVNPATTFPADTAMIYCTWKAEGVKVGDPARGVWIAEDVGAAAPPNYKIDEASLNLPFANAGSFSVSKPTAGWPVGKYRLEIYLGKSLSKTVPFVIE
jgi:hypothetical protein